MTLDKVNEVLENYGIRIVRNKELFCVCDDISEKKFYGSGSVSMREAVKWANKMVCSDEYNWPYDFRTENQKRRGRA